MAYAMVWFRFLGAVGGEYFEMMVSRQKFWVQEARIVMLSKFVFSSSPLQKVMNFFSLFIQWSTNDQPIFA